MPARATISASNLTTAGSTALAARYTTASISPAKYKVLLLCVTGWANPAVNSPLPKGLGLDWTLVATQSWGVISRYRTSMFYAVTDEATLSGTIDIVFSADQTAATWSVVEVSGADTADPIVQSITNSGSAVTTINATLSAFMHSQNAHFAAVSVDLNPTTNDAITSDPQFAELGQWDEPNNNQTIQTEWAVNETTCDPTFASADCAIVSAEIRADGRVIFPRPDAPVTQTLEYKTNILTSYNGTEQRIALRPDPRTKWEANIFLPDESEIRRWRADLSRDRVQFKFPWWPESVFTTADASATDTVISGDFTLAEIVQGDLILLVTQDEQTMEIAEVSSIAGGNVTVTTGITNAFPAGSEIVLLRRVQFPDNMILRRHSNNAARIGMTLHEMRQVAPTGKGAPSITTLGSLNVLDRRPMNTELIPEKFRMNVEVIDWGNKHQYATAWDYANVNRELRFMAQTESERQYWKAFLAAINGSREPFLAPTWRPDFVLDSQPTQGSDTITVQATPDIIDEYSGSLAHDWVYLQTNGVDHLSAITSYTDNGSTIDIVMTTALNNDPDDSTINVVSHMEQVRLGSDTVLFEHFYDYIIVKISTEVVQV